MSGPAAAVVDASTVVKWALEDEEAREGALALLDDYVAGTLRVLHAPTLLTYEITQALRRAEWKRRIRPDQADLALEQLLALEIEPHQVEHTGALALARRYTTSTYDASYVALAHEMGLELWTGDGKLCRATAALGFVRWVGDYRAG